MISLVPEGNKAIQVLKDIFEECDKRGIGYKIDGVPLCLLGQHIDASGDPEHVIDRDLRVFVKPGEHKDYMLAHRGYQRILQYGYRDQCSGCTQKTRCAGLHKKYDKSWQIQAF